MFRQLTVYLFSLVALASTPAMAQSIDMKDADLACIVSRSETLYVFAQQQQVYYSYFLREVKPLRMSDFKVYRCPFCYSFSGTANGKTYDASTRGRMDPDTREWNVNFDLQIDGEDMAEGLYCLPKGS